MNQIKTLPTKTVQSFNVALVHKTTVKVSADPRAGKYADKYTVVIVNGDEKCCVSGWVKDYEAAFNEARLCMEGTKWEF